MRAIARRARANVRQRREAARLIEALATGGGDPQRRRPVSLAPFEDMLDAADKAARADRLARRFYGGRGGGRGRLPGYLS